MTDSAGLLDRAGGPIVVFAALGLVVSAGFAPMAWQAATAPDGTVAVIEMHGTITSQTATAAIDDLREARHNDSIRAVVLDVNSPGGAASASEQLYLAVKRTKKVMPVVVSVTGLSASGSYYTSVPADKIYVTPASTVGSVGVHAVVPPQGVPSGDIVTGPDKASTSTRAEARRRVESLHRAFVDAVMAERSDKLELSRQQLSYAKVYSGTRAVKLGLADEIGGIDTAINDAANQAGLSEYETTRMKSPKQGLLSQIGLNASSGAQPTTQTTFDYTGVDTTQYLMLHGQIQLADSAHTTEVTANGTN
ncbi:MAG: S49 family peptidase [Halorientalis sp.]